MRNSYNCIAGNIRITMRVHSVRRERERKKREEEKEERERESGWGERERVFIN